MTNQAEKKKPEVSGALAGLRVIDCTHVIAGAWCSLILADLGADVIKVEGPQGDVSRALIGPEGNFTQYPYFNRNKRAIGIDLARDEGREVLRKLAVSADVFVENYRPGALEKMGLGYEALAAVNPGLVYCSISGFGATGPYRDRGGLDLITQAMSGIMSFTGEPGGTPMPCPAPISDLNAGTFGAIGVLAALRERDLSGRGQQVQTNLLSAVHAYTSVQAGQYFMTGAVAKPVGPRGAFTAPYEAFPAADGDIVIAAGTESLWKRVVEVLSDATIAADRRFETMAARLANRAALHEKISAVLRTDSCENWLAKLAAKGVPVGQINNVAEAIDHPQLQALGAVVDVEGERYIRTPIDLGRTPVAVTRGSPALGQDSRAILSELGFSAAEIDAALAGGAVLEPASKET